MFIKFLADILAGSDYIKVHVPRCTKIAMNGGFYVFCAWHLTQETNKTFAHQG